MWSRQNKNIVREMVMPSRQVSASLWMPGCDVLDFGQAVVCGLIDMGGTHILVERDADTLGEIKKIIAGWGWTRQPIAFGRALSKLLLHEAIPDGIALSYAHFDFCGGLTYPDAKVIASLPIATDAEICFTLMYVPARGNEFVGECKTLIDQNPVLRKVFEYEETNLQRHDKNVSYCATIIRSVLSHYKFYSSRPVIYSDIHYRMVVYRYHGFERQTPVLPNLLEMLDQRRKLARDSSGSLAADFYYAATRREWRNAISRLKSHLLEKVKMEHSPTMVIAGVKAAHKRLFDADLDLSIDDV